MDRFGKALGRLTDKDRKRIKAVLVKLRQGDLAGLNVKKLRGLDDLFRIRVGVYRVIYRWEANGRMTALEITRRSDTTYRF